MMRRRTPSHRRSGPLALAVAAALSLGLGACSLTGNPPQLLGMVSAMPAGYAEQSLSGAAVTEPDWWRSFNSDELSALIAAALSANSDLAIATERVLQAEVQVRIAGASLLPAVGFGAGTSRRETRPSGGSWSRSDGSNASFSASYEIDLWGRNAAGVRAAGSTLRATRCGLRKSVIVKALTIC